MAATSAGPSVSADEGVPTPSDYYRHLNRHRFTVELELLSSLASPAYLTHLYAQGHLHDPAFIRYVAFLVQTWSQPTYVRFLRFPNALIFARALVKSPTFRHAVGTDGWEHEVSRELIAAWANGSAPSSSSTTTAAATAVHEANGGAKEEHEVVVVGSGPEGGESTYSESVPRRSQQQDEGAR